jgi:hypothetical protein
MPAASKQTHKKPTPPVVERDHASRLTPPVVERGVG